MNIPSIIRSHGYLLLLGIALELSWLSLYLIEPLRKHVLNESTLTMRSGYLFIAVTVLLMVNLALYFWSLRFVQEDKISARIIFIFFAIFSATLLFVWPVASLDVFLYIGRGRVSSAHHQNPYTTSYSSLPQDRFYPQINHYWLDMPTPYGPIFSMIVHVLTKIGASSLPASLFVFKFFFTAANFLILWIVYVIFKDNRVRLLYAWNPLLLFELVLNAHSDILTVLLVGAALYFSLNRKPAVKPYLISWFFLLLSVYVKYMTIFFLPFFFFYYLIKLPAKTDKIHFALYGTGLSVASLIVYLPFISAQNFFIALKALTSMQISAVGYPPVAVMIVLAVMSDLGFAGYYEKVVLVCRFIFAVGLAGGFAFLIKRRDYFERIDIATVSAIVFAGFLALFAPWIMPWYFSLLVFLLIVSYAQHPGRLSASLIFAASYIPIFFYFFLR